MFKKFIIIFIIIAAINGVVLYLLASRNDSESSDVTDSKNAIMTDKVEISNFSYSPSVIRVKVGTKVTWTNKDTVQHNVVGDDLKDLSGPLLATNKSYSFIFDTVGTYGYHCAPHPDMKGTVLVTN
ncbi:MAG TPA: cupredoxin family copper-binding protein [Candidatus Saccharibacteria bacterium]|nr:cupredoxin family copper-binding protein [Candidatus Saccharibacteria bacterium]